MYGQSIPCQGNSPVQLGGMAGLGCPGCGGTCGRAGLGLFDAGFDPSTWGIAEWAVVIGGAYVVGSVLFTTKRAVRSVQGGMRKRASRARRKAELKEQLKRL